MLRQETPAQAVGSLSPERCHQARIERDPAFDGRFFFAVTTTGIYCRPVCPARRALAKNVRYFESAASAATAGFRPCRRCRPEVAPSVADVGHEVVESALDLIDRGALDEGSVEELAARLGVGERRLRRLFKSTVGASPIKMAVHRRLLVARQMLEASSTSVIDVAFAAGFSSLRRFNEAFRDTFDMSPTELRLGEARTGTADIVLQLGVRSPFDGEGLLRFLKARAIPGVERVDLGENGGGRYTRTFRLSGHKGVVSVTVDGSTSEGQRELAVEIQFSSRPDRFPNVLPLVERVKRVFDLGFDPKLIEHFSDDPLLSKIHGANPGIRVPGCVDPFELAVRAVLGQQVTVAGATTLSGRVVERWGEPMSAVGSIPRSDDEPDFLFPTSEQLAEAPLEEIGIPGSRARTLRALAQAANQDADLFDPSQDLTEFEQRFTQLPGIGPWTAHYVAMRALSSRDAFLSGDLVLRKRLAENGKLPSAAQLERLSQQWRPYRAYAGMLLWRSA